MSLFLIGVIAWIVLDQREQSTREQWDAKIGDWPELIARYPATSISQDAIELVKILSELTIEMPRRIRGNHVRLSVSAERLPSLSWSAYSTIQLSRPHDAALEKPPVELLKFMSLSEAKMEELRHLLRFRPILEWEFQLAEHVTVPIQDLTGLRATIRLLTDSALVNIWQGDTDAALEDLDALWRLCESYNSSPLILSQSIALHGKFACVMLLRRIPRAPEIWRERIRQSIVDDTLLLSIGLDFRMRLSPGERYFDTRFTRKNLFWKLAFPVRKKTTAVCMVEESRHGLLQYAAARRLWNQCDQPEAREILAKPLDSRTCATVMGNPALRAEFLVELSRVYRLRAELTLLLLEGAQESDAMLRTRTSPLAEARPSTACQDGYWSYAKGESGFEIRYSRPHAPKFDPVAPIQDPLRALIPR